MILYPDVQKKAQEEIDGVICNKRLPNCSDRSSLPYINAVVKEVLRWNPVVPMGLPHTSTVDDMFEGYFIPKDENGAQPELLFTPGMISHPEPFKAAITPRSPQHEQLIRSLEQEFPWEQSGSHIIEKM
jgi:hypothetical protein